MHSKRQKYRAFLSRAFKYFFDFVVVFVGVFLAFWLNEYKDQQQEAEKKREIYTALYEELQAFYESGRPENEKGFIRFFRKLDQRSDSLIARKELPLKMNLYGDYWKIPIIHSFVQNGLLRDIDINTFKKVTRFNTVHQNFLENIRDYNLYYDKYVTAEYEQGMDHFFEEGSSALKPKYTYLEGALEGIAGFAEILVRLAGELATEIKEDHLDIQED